MSKVYNRVEWVFLKKLLEKLGFDNRWISLISSCIHFVSFFFMVNGAPHGHFTPNRGLCQGNPLFPYLFLLCVEGLHSLIQLAKDFGTLHGVSLCRAGPKVSHLFFVDNSLLFCKASQNDCNNILEILQLYESASGQQINKDKTQLFFSSNTGQDMQAHVKITLGISAITHIESYLHLWDEEKNKASIILGRGFGIICKDERKNSYHNEVEKFW